MDCFVALLLAMMAGAALTIRDQLLIRARVVRFLAGLHETETFLDLAEHKRKILALPRGKPGQDLLLLALQPRDLFFLRRLAPSCPPRLYSQPSRLPPQPPPQTTPH